MDQHVTIHAFGFKDREGETVRKEAFHALAEQLPDTMFIVETSRYFSTGVMLVYDQELETFQRVLRDFRVQNPTNVLIYDSSASRTLGNRYFHVHTENGIMPALERLLSPSVA